VRLANRPLRASAPPQVTPAVVQTCRGTAVARAWAGQKVPDRDEEGEAAEAAEADRAVSSGSERPHRESVYAAEAESMIRRRDARSRDCNRPGRFGGGRGGDRDRDPLAARAEWRWQLKITRRQRVSLVEIPVRSGEQGRQRPIGEQGAVDTQANAGWRPF
jgi:hypothetical protein